MVLIAVLSEGGVHRQRGGCASSFRGGVPGYSPSITGVRCSCPLAHTHHSSRGPRILPRWMVYGLRQQTSHSCRWSLCALDGCWLMFNTFARALSCMPMDRPRCIQMLSLSSTHCTYRINTIRCVLCIEPQRRGEGLGEDGRSHVGGWIERDRSSSCFFLFSGPVCPELQIAVNADAYVSRPVV